MNKQRGIATAWVYLLVMVGAFGGTYWYAQHRQAAADKIVYDSFVNLTKAAGEKARADARITEANDKANKEKVDAQNQLATDKLNATIRSLRNARPSGGFVPAAPAGAARPDLACYDRTEFSAAVGRLVDGVRGIAEESAKATLDLNSAKEWALKPKMDTEIK